MNIEKLVKEVMTNENKARELVENFIVLTKTASEMKDYVAKLEEERTKLAMELQALKDKLQSYQMAANQKIASETPTTPTISNPSGVTVDVDIQRARNKFIELLSRGL